MSRLTQLKLLAALMMLAGPGSCLGGLYLFDAVVPDHILLGLFGGGCALFVTGAALSTYADHISRDTRPEAQALEQRMRRCAAVSSLFWLAGLTLIALYIGHAISTTILAFAPLAFLIAIGLNIWYLLLRQGLKNLPQQGSTE